MQTAIISSLLDTDLYKFTMMQAVLHQFPSAYTKFQFKCRNNIDLTPYIDEINEELDALCELRFTPDELNFLSQLDYITSDFIAFLRLFQLHRPAVQVTIIEKQLSITIKGTWLHTILFEVPVLAIVNEVYFRNTCPTPDIKTGVQRLQDKIALIQSLHDKRFIFSDFGTRRRFSHHWQEQVIDTLKTQLPQNFSGTSNVYFAKKFHLTPIGTMAHEFLQAAQALGVRLRDSQQFALQSWVNEYRGKLGIALTDVISMDAFLKDFDLYFAKLFDGLRHDSGDPFTWGEKAIAHYQKLQLDPQTKTLVFSDGLSTQKAIDIFHTFKDRTHPVFGIGTHLTNDLGYEPLQIVIKMTTCNNQTVAKISDSKGKSMCQDSIYINYLKKVFDV